MKDIDVGKEHIDPANITSAADMIQRVDPFAIKLFRKMPLVPPVVVIIDTAAKIYLFDVMPIFQAGSNKEAAEKKLTFVPVVREYIAKREIVPLAYCLIIQGHWAPDDSERVKKELVQGIAIRGLTDREPAVLYAAECVGRQRTERVAGTGDEITTLDVSAPSYAFGHRRIRLMPRHLLDIEVTSYDRAPRRIGFGVL